METVTPERTLPGPGTEKTFLIPGDLEKAGWAKLLERADFRAALAPVDVFIASHHGRESGYCKEVFDYATGVEVFVFSDSSISYATQEMATVYGNHASGVMFNDQLRKVLTTRNDGPLTWAWNSGSVTLSRDLK